MSRTLRLGVLIAVMLLPGTPRAAEEWPGSCEGLDLEECGQLWWEWDPTPWGALTASWVYAAGSSGERTQGPRLSYGPMGIGDEYYGWAEFWLAFRKGTISR